MDFVDGLPPSGGKNCILVIVDRFSKYAHFIPMDHPFTALTVAKTFITNVYSLHGLPLSIVLDRDKIFTSQLWQELFCLAGVTLRMSSATRFQKKFRRGRETRFPFRIGCEETEDVVKPEIQESRDHTFPGCFPFRPSVLLRRSGMNN